MTKTTNDKLLQPTKLEDVQACIHAALSNGEALEVRGGGSKRFYGHPVEAARVMSTAKLAGFVDYQPHELILVAKPGTPMTEVESALEKEGQMLAFEPPHWGAGATLGGVLACNLSGPRRFKAGAARDHLLGFQAVTGRGEVVRGGGRVVKNVTGYDLSKLMCGSFGTLAVLTEVVVKVLPRAESERTLIFRGLKDGEGLALLGRASRSPHEPSGLAHLPAGSILPDSVERGGGAAASLTAIRLEGPDPSVRQRCVELESIAGVADPFLLEREPSLAFWVALRELEPLLGFPLSGALEKGTGLWRFSVPPQAGVALGASLRSQGELRMFFDWGGGLVWAVLPESTPPAELHALAETQGGTAQWVRSGGETGGTNSKHMVFTDLSPARRKLNLNLKLAFDPHRILNPGRMYPGI